MQRMRRFRLRPGPPKGRIHCIRLVTRPFCMRPEHSARRRKMQLKRRSPELALQAGQVLTLDDAQGARILSRRGTVWITEEGNNKDHIVGPGDAIVVARPG